MRLRFSAPVTLAAKAKGPRRLAILAYTGDVMTVSGFGPVLIDLAGLESPKSVPLLADHENALGAMVGSGQPANDGKMLVVDGTAADNDAGREVVSLLEGGHDLQASVGAEPTDTRFVDAGEVVNVNGRTITADDAGFTLVMRAALKEVSVTPIGADDSTSVSLAAKAARKGRPMKTSFQDYCKGLGVTADDDMDASVKSALQKAYKAAFPDDDDDDDDRDDKPAKASALIGILAGCPHSLQLRAANERWSVRRCQTEALHFLRAQRPAGNYGGGGRGDDDATADHLTAGLLVRAGYHAAAEKAYGPRVMEQVRAGRFDKMSLPDALSASLRANGVDTAGKSFDEMIRASGTTTNSLSQNLLANLLGKLLEATWQNSPATWRSWCAVRQARDFKPQLSVRVSHIDGLRDYSGGNELAGGVLGDDGIKWQVAPFGRIVTLSRETIVNDDLNGLTEIPMGMAMAAQRSLSDLIYSVLMADAGSNFTSGHGNVQTGGGSALSSAALNTAILQLRKQTAPNGSPMNIPPAVLVVPPELEQTAKELLHSTFQFRDQTADRQQAGNSFVNIASLEVEPRLSQGCRNPSSNSNPVAGSTSAWYLFGAPTFLPAIVGFLRTGDGPTVEAAGPDFNFDKPGQSWRVLMDAGFSLGDFRAAQKSAGA